MLSIRVILAETTGKFPVCQFDMPCIIYKRLWCTVSESARITGLTSDPKNISYTWHVMIHQCDFTSNGAMNISFPFNNFIRRMYIWTRVSENKIICRSYQVDAHRMCVCVCAPGVFRVHRAVLFRRIRWIWWRLFEH